MDNWVLLLEGKLVRRWIPRGLGLVSARVWMLGLRIVFFLVIDYSNTPYGFGLFIITVFKRISAGQ
jgi:hypothetical protein